jgi:5-formyltetrahydrofolate cyclo-ligase
LTPLPDIAERKARLRAEVLARRDAMDPEARAAGSTAICRALLSVVPPGAAVSAFLPIRSEVDLTAAADALVERGHPVGLPVIHGRHLVFRAYHPQGSLVSRGFGTRGPDDDAPEVVPDLMLVPFSVFDRTLNRIGYGKAYYDTTIAAFAARGHHPLLVGVGFSVQEVDRVPVEPHDVPLHRIVTEREIIEPPAG